MKHEIKLELAQHYTLIELVEVRMKRIPASDDMKLILMRLRDELSMQLPPRQFLGLKHSQPKLTAEE